MLRVKQGGIKYHFLSLWYDITRDLTMVSISSTNRPILVGWGQKNAQTVALQSGKTPTKRVS